MDLNIKYEFSLTRILPYKDRIDYFVLIWENTVSENPCSLTFYAVLPIIRTNPQRIFLHLGLRIFQGIYQGFFISISIIFEFASSKLSLYVSTKFPKT